MIAPNTDFRMMLDSRHIQNFSEAQNVEPHWGYADRVIPCANDIGSCAYLDVVYRSHDLGMYYTGIIWATIVGSLLVWAVVRRFTSVLPSGLHLSNGVQTKETVLKRAERAVRSYFRRYLLPDAPRVVFGRVSRAQVLTLFVLTAYLTIWSFVGIVYNTWITPVKKMPGVYNTRTSLGPWSDRIGVMAYALTPLSVLLSTRESILSLATGLPYQSFNFLHRWLGYVIFLQSSLHTIGWCVIEIRLYQPQPNVALAWIKQTYMIWGVVAMMLLTILVVLSTPWGIRLTGYEVFRKLHYVLAMVYIGACWGHWEQLKVFLLPSLVVWFLDRLVRLARSALLHYKFLPTGEMGFAALDANVQLFEDRVNGDILRLDFTHAQDAWGVGQHFYLCFPEYSVFQSHPFTPLSCVAPGSDSQQHSYIFRAKSGQTKTLAKAFSVTDTDSSSHVHQESYSSLRDAPRLKVLLTGPYGEHTVECSDADTNILALAGGTGITYVLPALLHLAAQAQDVDRKISLIWVIRRRRDLEWVAAELDVLKRRCKALRSSIHIYVTRDDEEKLLTHPTLAEKPVVNDCAYRTQTSGSESSTHVSVSSAISISGIAEIDVERTHMQKRPNLERVLGDFVNCTIKGRIQVLASGPGTMLSDIKSAVATFNNGTKVWKGQSRYDVSLVCDDRLEW